MPLTGYLKIGDIAGESISKLRESETLKLDDSDYSVLTSIERNLDVPTSLTYFDFQQNFLKLGDIAGESKVPELSDQFAFIKMEGVVIEDLVEEEIISLVDEIYDGGFKVVQAGDDVFLKIEKMAPTPQINDLKDDDIVEIPDDFFVG